MKMKSLKLTLILGAAVALMNVAALAGPGPEVYRPVTSVKALSALNPGTQVAHECPHCGAISIATVAKDKAHATGFTCPACKMKFTYRDAGAGKAPKIPVLECVDAKSGKVMSARVCAGH